jgi:hypothetical protein
MKSSGDASEAFVKALVFVGLSGTIIGAPFLSWLLESRFRLSKPVVVVGSSVVLLCSMLLLLYLLGRGEAGSGGWVRGLKGLFSGKKPPENG